MDWVTKLQARLYPKEYPADLSTVDRVRFITLLNIGLFGTLLLVIVVTINLIYQKYDRALDNVLNISAYLVPTIWLTYRYKLKQASWYLIIAMYISTIRGLSARIIAQADVHIELGFILIGLFSIVLLERKPSLLISIFLAINYLIARLLVFHYLHIPVEIGQLLNGFGVFIALIYVSAVVKKTAVTIQNVIQQQNKQLQEKNLELSELNHVKDKLFSILGHDLRSPIVSLKIQLLNVQKGYTSAQQYEEASIRLQQTVDGVFTTLDNLLNWALLQRGGIRVNPTQFDLSEIAQSVLQLYNVDFPSKQLAVTTDYEAAPVTADEYQLTIVARNLLQNAIKFTPIGGNIQLITRRLNGRSQLIVQDSGIGMPTISQTVPNGIGTSNYGTEGEKGTGLGLEISREFVRLNKGQLLIDSILGRGTTVTMEF
jgi:two-component system sensor histidine kinase/response regulator